MVAAAAQAHDGTDAATSGNRPTLSAEVVVAGAVDVPIPGELVAGKYRVERLLGRGGMGSVVAATHLQLGLSVAIKFLHREGAGLNARFAREGRILAQLHSEHIVRVFDSGRLEHGGPYIVMEQLVGQDLAQLTALGALPIRDAIAYVRQVCCALQAAHERGIIHRDLKPSNLFLATTTDSVGPGTIKVLDFGVSTHTSDSLESFTLTQTNMLLGSPRYMSPEQIRASGAVDRRTDIWSLGVILYELLTGRVPFPQRTLAALSIAIATEAPEPPRRFRQDLTVELEAIVLRCLAKDPARRFPTASALSDALAALDKAASPRAGRWLIAGAVSALLGASWALTIARQPKAADVTTLRAAPSEASAESSGGDWQRASSSTPAAGAEVQRVLADGGAASHELTPSAARSGGPRPRVTLRAHSKPPRWQPKTSLPLPAPEPKLVGPTDTPD